MSTQFLNIPPTNPWRLQLSARNQINRKKNTKNHLPKYAAHIKMSHLPVPDSIESNGNAVL